ncbi:unnamed protein product, partial [Closterium sp. NIES-53]
GSSGDVMGGEFSGSDAGSTVSEPLPGTSSFFGSRGAGTAAGDAAAAAKALLSETLPVASPRFWQLGSRPSTGSRLAGSARAAGSVDPWAWAYKTGNLARGSPMGGINCWSEAEVRNFTVRSKSYLRDKMKQSAGQPGMALVAVDWLKRVERIDHVVELKRTPVHGMREMMASSDAASRPYFFIVNMQVPAAQQFSMVFYWAMDEPPTEASILGQFINGDDIFRNTRFKLIPRIHQGAWVVKRSVGTTPLIIAGALTVQYFKGPDYFEVDVDIGSSAVANGVVRFVLGYVRTLIIDMAFVIQGNTDEELPEKLLGTIRISHLEPNAALDMDLDNPEPPPHPVSSHEDPKS